MQQTSVSSVFWSSAGLDAGEDALDRPHKREDPVDAGAALLRCRPAFSRSSSFQERMGMVNIVLPDEEWPLAMGTEMRKKSGQVVKLEKRIQSMFYSLES